VERLLVAKDVGAEVQGVGHSKTFRAGKARARRCGDIHRRIPCLQNARHDRGVPLGLPLQVKKALGLSPKCPPHRPSFQHATGGSHCAHGGNPLPLHLPSKINCGRRRAGQFELPRDRASPALLSFCSPRTCEWAYPAGTTSAPAGRAATNGVARWSRGRKPGPGPPVTDRSSTT
jgi:hypothetical protein